VSTLHDHHPVDLKKILMASDNSVTKQTKTHVVSAPGPTHQVSRDVLTDYFGVLFDRRFQFENYIV
jgi:hypothetical protein